MICTGRSQYEGLQKAKSFISKSKKNGNISSMIILSIMSTPAAFSAKLLLLSR